MKKIFTTFLLILALMLLLPASPATAQSALPHTTLAAAVSDAATKIISVSAAGTIAANYVMVIDHEEMQVISITSTNVTVARGYGGTQSTSHPSGGVIMYGPAANFYTRDFFGGCTAANFTYMPVVSANRNTKDIDLYNCNNGRWVQQILPDDIGATSARYCTIDVFNAPTQGASLSTFGYQNLFTNTTPVSGTTYFGTIEIPKTARITGLTVMNGSTAATDKLILTLYRADGTVLVSTDTAGTVASGANAYQTIAFSTPFLATGPSRYWVGVQINGTTTRLSTIPASSWVKTLGSSELGTFGTISNLISYTAPTPVPVPSALPTSLIADTTPNICAY